MARAPLSTACLKSPFSISFPPLPLRTGNPTSFTFTQRSAFTIFIDIIKKQLENQILVISPSPYNNGIQKLQRWLKCLRKKLIFLLKIINNHIEDKDIQIKGKQLSLWQDNVQNEGNRKLELKVQNMEEIFSKASEMLKNNQTEILKMKEIANQIENHTI